ncbi:MAG TPA: nitrilase-related carbon-nitrogen hydrolase [Cyclobacteriaceae bacterium]|nr:nitrilase-related carbon-nitrogen hydrolase [Cyclobacteriaceae bacterium]
MSQLILAGATLNQIPFDWENNLGNIRGAITEAKKQKAEILLLPELCISGYGCEDVFLSDWLSATAAEKLLTLVPLCDNIIVCVGLPIRMNGVTYNGVCVIRNQQILGITLKQNLADEGVHYEPRWFRAWKSGEVTSTNIGGHEVAVGDLIYTHRDITFGFEICEDAWRKNRPGYRLKERGVQLILNPSASHFALGKSTHREKDVVIDGSDKFQCVYLFVNHLGNEAGRMIYDGDIVVGQNGKLVAVNNRLSFKPFVVMTCPVDVSDASKTIALPITDNRERNEEFACAVSLALFDYLRKSKSRGFVLSLSGGADSACCAVLVAEMVRRASDTLGWPAFWSAIGVDPATAPVSQKEAVSKLLTCAYQASVNSSTTTRDAAKDLASSLGAQFHEWSIEEESSAYRRKIETVLGRALTWEQDDIALQNIQARSRSPIIWLLANVRRAVLLTTSNRSEGDVGYATMDGDTSGSLAPIAGIDKPFILQWLRWAQSQGYAGLAGVNHLQPTAELRPVNRAQTDEKDLMPYPALVDIEKLAIRDRRTPREVYEALKSGYAPTELKAWIKKFYQLWSANQWKRERLAPSFHVDDLNVDPRSWCRFPILSGGFREELQSLE